MPTYTTSPLYADPPAAASIACAPSGTGGVYGDWTEINPAVSERRCLASIAISAPSGVNGNIDVQIGVGAEDAEVMIAEVKCEFISSQFGNLVVVPLPLPIDAIPNGARVSARVSRFDTSTTAWGIAINYYKHPIAGNVVTTTATTGFASATIAKNGSAWVNSSWVQLIASAATDLYAFGYTVQTTDPSADFECDIGFGGSGSEVVAHTIRGSTPETPLNSCPSHMPIWPLFKIPSGTRVTLRYRHSLAAAGNVFASLLFYEGPSENLDSVSTTVGQQWSPTATTPATVNDGALSWANPASFTELSASLPEDRLITALNMPVGERDVEIDLAVGAAGSEVVIGTWRAGRSWSQGSILTLSRLVKAPAGQRLSARVRSDVTASTYTLSYGYLAVDDHDLVTDRVPTVVPLSSNVFSITPSGTAWQNSAWVQAIAAIGVQGEITSIRLNQAVTAEFEFEIGVGAEGFETVATTIRGWTADTSASRPGFVWLPNPLRVAVGSRVVARLRKSGTNTTVWGFAFNFEETPTSQFDPDPGEPGPIYWTKLVHRDTDGSAKTFPWAPIAIADPSTYYDGFKPALLLSMGRANCPLSDRNGRLQVPTCSVTYSDLPGRNELMLMRGMLGRATQRALRGAEFTIYCITDSHRRLLRTPVIVFRGFVDRYEGPADYQFTIHAKGWIAKRLNEPLWPDTIRDVFPNAPATTRDRALPIAFGRLSDEASGEDPPVLTHDETSPKDRGSEHGDEWIVAYGDIGIAPPTTLAAAEEAGGNLANDGTWPGDEIFVMATRVVDGVEGDPEPFTDPTSGVTLTGSGKAIRATCDADGADAYRFYFGYQATGRILWSHYIETDDPETGVVCTDLPDPDSNTPVPVSAGGVQVQNYYGTLTVLAVTAQGRTALAADLVTGNWTSVRSHGYRRPVRMAIEPHPDALYYEWYFRYGPPNADYPFIFRFTTPLSQVNLDGNPYWEWDWVSVTYDEVNGAPEPQGMIPPIYCGQGFQSLDGNNNWHGWLISARPCAAFVSAYVKTDEEDAEFVRIPDADYATVWRAPGIGSYATDFGATPYYTVGDYKLCMIFGLGPTADAIAAGTSQLRVNVHGRDTDDDGTGDVETSIYEHFRVLAKNALLTDTPSIEGDFDQDPEFSDGTKRLDDDSLDLAALNAAAAMPAGAAGARWLPGSMTVAAFLQDLCPSGKLKVGIKPNGQVIAVVHNPFAAPVATIDERREVIDGSFAFQADDQGFANAQPYALTPVYDESGGVSLVDEASEEDTLSQSEARYGAREPGETLALTWRTSPLTARSTARAFLRESAYLPIQGSNASVLHWLHRSPGDVVALTHRQGPTASGWTERRVASLGLVIDLPTYRVEMPWLDLGTHVGEVSPFLSEMFFMIQELGGSRLDSLAIEGSLPVLKDWRFGIINWGMIPQDTHEVVFDATVATSSGTITPNLYLSTDDTGDAPVATATAPTSHNTNTLTRQQHVLTHPGEDVVRTYWALPVLAGGATYLTARMFARLRIREIGSES